MRRTPATAHRPVIRGPIRGVRVLPALVACLAASLALMGCAARGDDPAPAAPGDAAHAIDPCADLDPADAPTGPGTIWGAVRTLRGAPAAGAQVWVHGTVHGVLTDDRGRFTLDGVPAGTYVLAVQSLGYGAQWHEIDGGITHAAPFCFVLRPIPVVLHR